MCTCLLSVWDSVRIACLLCQSISPALGVRMTQCLCQRREAKPLGTDVCVVASLASALLVLLGGCLFVGGPVAAAGVFEHQPPCW